MMPLNTKGLADFLKIIAVLREIGIDTIDVLIKGPNVQDEEAFRAWVRAMVKVGKTLAVVTPNVYDDAVMNVLAALVESDPAWNAFYGMVRALLNGQPVAKDSPAAVVAHDLVKVIQDG